MRGARKAPARGRMGGEGRGGKGRSGKGGAAKDTGRGRYRGRPGREAPQRVAVPSPSEAEGGSSDRP